MDRDGVINRDSAHYIKSWDEFRFLPGSLKAIQMLTQNGFPIIIISNQSAVGQQLMTFDALEALHQRMRETIQASGGAIADIFYCPHLPGADCNCRKPKPGLIHQALSAHRIPVASTCMVGDSVKDIQCAKTAGCGCTVLVLTGNGIEAEKALGRLKLFPDHVASNLYDAAAWIIANRNH